MVCVRWRTSRSRVRNTMVSACWFALLKVSAATRFQGHRAGREGCKEGENLAAAQLLAKDHGTRTVSPMELKDVLGEIEADGAHLVHGRLREWALTPPLWHADAVGGVHTITPPSPARRTYRQPFRATSPRRTPIPSRSSGPKPPTRFSPTLHAFANTLRQGNRLTH